MHLHDALMHQMVSVTFPPAGSTASSMSSPVYPPTCSCPSSYLPPLHGRPIQVLDVEAGSAASRMSQIA